MTARHGAALDTLRALDRSLGADGRQLRSLAPGRGRATPFVVLGEQLFGDAVPASVSLAVARALDVIARAQADAFPGNLFWDFELPAGRLLAAAVTVAEGSADAVERAARDIAALERAFGRHGPIQFRYAHDFLYGFDWARWVRQEPARRGAVGPFEPEFIAYMQRRGGELVELIAANDAKYPSLPRGAARNPFGFRREPADEERLHRDLAERGLVPVEAWRFDAAPRWDLPFSDLREDRAEALGLARRAR